MSVSYTHLDVYKRQALCSLYLNEFNAESAHQVIGFVPEAMELLQSYPWPGNMDQLKRVIRQLTLTAERSYTVSYTHLDVYKRQFLKSVS